MLEESSFANKKADYFWLLFLSSVMLLVKTNNSLSPVVERSLTSILGTLTTIQSALLVILPCIRTNILVVTTASLHANLTVRINHNNCTLPPCRTRRVLVGPQRHLESRCRRSGRLCSRPRWVVSPWRLDTRDGRRLHVFHWSPSPIVSRLHSFRFFYGELSCEYRKRLFGDRWFGYSCISLRDCIIERQTNAFPEPTFLALDWMTLGGKKKKEVSELTCTCEWWMYISSF